MGKVYIHCDGEQLKLSDSDRGSNTEYTATSYYVWNTGSHEQLLFTFPTRVSLTTIKVHYYSDCVRGRPRLILYAVPDDFDVWNLPTGALIFVGPGTESIPPGGEPTGGKYITFKSQSKFNTIKVVMSMLMSKLRSGSDFQFAVSEVEFFTGN